jgi:enoyl-CoA hydratase
VTGVDVAVRNRVLEVTLVNPPDNRLTPAMVEGLYAATSRLEADDVDMLLIGGTKRVFSKGFDIAAIKSYPGPSELRKVLVLSNAVFSRIARSPKLTIAAISGACMGGGLELAMACHLRVCAEKSRLGLPEVWIDLVPGLGGFYRLARLVGTAKALELVALGDLITAEEALRLNLVSRVLPQQDFASHVSSFVGALATANQKVLRHIIRMAARSEPPGEEDNIRDAAETFVELMSCSPKT